MNAHVDHSIGPWVIESEGNHAILVVKDIDCMVEDLGRGLTEKRLKSVKRRLIDIMSNMEFAAVHVQQNGMVKWQGGQFANGETSITIDDVAKAAGI